MFHTILVPTDGSCLAECAGHAAVSLAKGEGAKPIALCAEVVGLTVAPRFMS